ncbi:type I-E CRISPR-associated protein Cas6/Cse3/CasE [Jatrophihabitans lederbergiae]|uniref:Type I-E CRISPR-associated protein Cas6/Cse3/CasE n=1 Tax=Jatrophihabitans lederbergiae TaxID=3075547 RepID=A0ABU2J505_9ACTN|nr:type I-E CRISPR-associated protein Cas6/Cse3/CasE [Jatrophihabitans sp. DSM 44399]MDT0260060.1 type I-E CRISPR-associated protein Cas6/Cse3/CasE [Jatrophihabitans sp. DSM 44399]
MTHYLTRFEINATRRGAMMLMASPQKMHAATMAAFPAAEHSDTGRILWRLDASGPHHWLYLLSPTEPDLTHLVEQAGWPSKPHWETRDYAPLLHKLDTGQRWAFRLRANPTHTVTENGRKRVFGHVTATQKLDWLLRRTESLGIAIPASSAGEPDVLLSGFDQRVFQREGSKVTLALAGYEGNIEVTDPERLRIALTAGIGRGKAYGCGLMTLARQG